MYCRLLLLLAFCVLLRWHHLTHFSISALKRRRDWSSPPEMLFSRQTGEFIAHFRVGNSLLMRTEHSFHCPLSSGEEGFWELINGEILQWGSPGWKTDHRLLSITHPFIYLFVQGIKCYIYDLCWLHNHKRNLKVSKTFNCSSCLSHSIP